MRPDTKEYCDSVMFRVRNAVENQDGYLLKDEFQQVIYEFRRDNPRFPAWVVQDEEGYFFPITYDSAHQYTFISKNHAIEDISDFFGGEVLSRNCARVSDGKYRLTWIDPGTGCKRYSCFILRATDDNHKKLLIVDIIRQVVEFRNACLEDSGDRFDPFLESPPTVKPTGYRRKKH